jgi:hypothetical protein
MVHKGCRHFLLKKFTAAPHRRTPFALTGPGRGFYPHAKVVANEAPSRTTTMHLPANTFRRHLVLGGLASTLLVAAGCSKSAKPKSKTLPKEATLLCLGDSLTFGYGAATGGSYPQAA